jgi:hypothetical protein
VLYSLEAFEYQHTVARDDAKDDAQGLRRPEYERMTTSIVC